jgi:hypothetical protein
VTGGVRAVLTQHLFVTRRADRTIAYGHEWPGSIIVELGFVSGEPGIDKAAPKQHIQMRSVGLRDRDAKRVDPRNASAARQASSSAAGFRLRQSRRPPYQSRRLRTSTARKMQSVRTRCNDGPSVSRSTGGLQRAPVINPPCAFHRCHSNH